MFWKDRYSRDELHPYSFVLGIVHTVLIEVIITCLIQVGIHRLKTIPDTLEKNDLFVFKNRFVWKPTAPILHENRKRFKTICHHLRDYFGCQMPPGIFVPQVQSRFYIRPLLPMQLISYGRRKGWVDRQTPAVKVRQRLFFCVAFHLLVERAIY